MNLEEGEELVFQGSCLYHKGLLAHMMTFILTSQKLWFGPSRFLDRFVGVKEITIDLATIDNIQIMGIDKFVSIQTAEKQYRFSQEDSVQLHSYLKTVIQPEQGKREKRLTQDKCLVHRGVLAHPVEVILTTEQLIFYGKRFLDRLAGLRDTSVSARELLSVEVKGIDRIVHLQAKDKSYRFSGSGALRLVPMFERIIRYYQDSEDAEAPKKIRPVLAQGAIQFFIIGSLGVNGEFVLNRDELKLTSYKSVLTMLFGEINLTIPLKEGVSFLEGSTKQKLGIKYKDQTIWMGGNKVTVIHFFLRQLNSYSETIK